MLFDMLRDPYHPIMSDFCFKDGKSGSKLMNQQCAMDISSVSSNKKLYIAATNTQSLSPWIRMLNIPTDQGQADEIMKLLAQQMESWVARTHSARVLSTSKSAENITADGGIPVAEEKY